MPHQENVIKIARDDEILEREVSEFSVVGLELRKLRGLGRPHHNVFSPFVGFSSITSAFLPFATL
jgi:hypothetical protein